MSLCDNEVTLEIQGTQINCKKSDLIQNSDYFKVMFEGSFVERNKSIIKIEGIELKAMNLILTLLWDESYIIDEEDVFSVLQAASMLQFNTIKNMCIEKITEYLSPKNCLRVWVVTDQLSIRPLFLKAKSLALNVFMEIKDTESITVLSLEGLCNYLGNVYLRADTEFSVFQTAMRWWYESNISENRTDNLLKVLNCVSYKQLSESYLKEAMTYPDIADNEDILNIFRCLCCMKNNKSVDGFPQNCQNRAHLWLGSVCRSSPECPCILVHPPIQKNIHESKMMKGVEQVTIFYDNFKRKRLYETLANNKSDFAVIIYDTILGQFKNFFHIGSQKCDSLEGFKLMCYKEFIFLYGGEYLFGKGKWNFNFWVYDTIRERWERKTVMRYPRRHFETCIVGNKVFITGGTGMFRLIQENMFWYDYKEDQWSKENKLPIYNRQLKCCSFLNQYLLFSINDKCGYFFKDDTDYLTWIKMEVILDETLINNQSDFILFSYKDQLYIKGKVIVYMMLITHNFASFISFQKIFKGIYFVLRKNIIELTLVDNKFLVTSVRHLTESDCDKMEAVLCNNIVYTLYKYRLEETVYSLETYNLDTNECNYLFKELKYDSIIEVQNNKYVISSALKIFGFVHYSLVENNILVNTF